MIDTIELRIHNVAQNEKFFRAFFKPDEGKLNKFSNEQLKPEQMTFLRWKEYTNLKTGKQKVVYRNTWRVPSSAYEVSYRILSDFPHVDVQFSIPKLLFGNNLMQFVQHPNEVETLPEIGFFDLGSNITMEQHLKSSYVRLFHFLDKFYKWLCPTDKALEQLLWRNTQIKRIDFCFNQFHESGEMAMKYIEYQKRIRKKYIRETTKNKYDWHSSIYIVTSNYTAKIYHKGTEFKKNDAKELRAQNAALVKAGKPERWNIEAMQAEADKIVRYEIGFRNGFMSLMYRKHIWHNVAPTWNYFLDCFKKFESINKKLEVRENAIRTTSPERFKKRYGVTYEQAIKQLNEERRLLDADRIELNDTALKLDNIQDRKLIPSKAADIAGMVLNTRCQFFLEQGNEAHLFNHQWESNREYHSRGFIYSQITEELLRANARAFYSYRLHELLGRAFINFFNEYQVHKRAQFTDFDQKLIEVNETANYYGKRKLKPGRIKTVAALLTHYTWEEIKKLKLLGHKSTVNRMKRDLERLGYDGKNNIADLAFNCSKDFKHYYSLTFENPHFKLRNYFFK